MFILPLAQFYNFNQRFPALPSWYTEAYTQEDRLKQLALVNQRQLEWTELALEKINEVVEVLNDTGSVDVSVLLKDIQDVKTDVSTIKTEITSISSLIVDLDTAVNSNATDVSNLDTELKALASKVNTLETSVNSANTSIGNINTELTTIKTNITNNTNNIATLDSDLATVVSDINTIQGKLSEIDTLEISVSEIRNNVNDTNSEISNLKTSQSTITTDVSDLGVRVQALEDSPGGGGEATVVKVESDEVYDGINIKVDDKNNYLTFGSFDGSLNVDLQPDPESRGGYRINLEANNSGGSGSTVEVEADEVYDGVNFKVDNQDNYLTFGSFGGTVDVSLESDPESRGGYRINLEANNSGGGGGGSSLEIIKQFGTEFSSGKFSLLKDDSLTSYEENFTLDYIGEFGSDNRLYATIDDNKLYIYDSGEWLFPQNVITPEYTGANPMGRYIPIIMDKNIPENTKVYWDGEKDTDGKRIYKAPFYLGNNNASFTDDGTVSSLAVQSIYDGLGNHSIVSVNVSNFRTDKPSVYSDSSITCVLNELTIPSELVLKIANPITDQATATITGGTATFSFTK